MHHPVFGRGGGVFQIYNANLLLPILWTNWKQFDGLNIFSITSLQFQIPRRSTLYKWWGKIRSTGFRKLDSHKRIGVELQQIDKLPTWGYTCAQKWCGNLRPRYSALYVGQNFEKKINLKKLEIDFFVLAKLETFSYVYKVEFM